MKKLKFTLNAETGTLSESDAKRYFSTVGFATFAFTVIYFVSSVLLGYAISYFAPFLYESTLICNFIYNLISLIPLYALAFPVLYGILRRLPRDRVQPEKMGAGGFFKGLCVALFVMMAGNYVSQFLINIFQLITGKALSNPVAEATSNQSFWINLLFVAIVAPILEELVFRKVLCDRLLPLGEGYTVVLSAAIFALAHGNFFQFFYAFLLGALFALIYVKTGRLRYSILYHGILNFLGAVVSSWLLKRVEHLITEDSLAHLAELGAQGDMTALQEMLQSYILPMVPLLAYELVVIVGSVCGMVFLIVGYKKIRLEKGLLSPPKEGRVANVFLNVGVAAALTAFAGIFLLSLMG
ncbi:MAG: CPBP family intramembrane metalloprotease [Clostridia bacterium]|nr:CPBP family intramembrane metalloprotease [Clostridia bacterium]